MKKLRWQLLVVLVALIAIGFLLLGQQQTLLEIGQPEVAPLEGGIYTEALIGSPGRFNPILDYYNSVDRDIDRLVFSSMIRFDHRGLPQGDLVDSWGVSQDGKTFSFSIRPEAFWHDGQPVVSEDIVFTVGLLSHDKVPLPADLRSFWKQVKVSVLNEKTLQFILPEPFAPFLDYLTFGILPSHLLKDLSVEELINSSYNLKPVGSGPYRLADLTLENDQIAGVVLSAFDQYYGKKPFISQINFRYYPDSASALSAYRDEKVMGISQVTTDVLPELLKEPKLNLFTSRMPGVTMIFLNLNSPRLPFLQDAQLRRALLMSINRRWIVERLMGGQAIMANGPIFPESWAYYDGMPTVEYSVEDAIAILKKAEYTIPAEGGSVRVKDEVSLEFEMVCPDEEPYPAIAEQIRSDWARLGVKVNIKTVAYNDLLKKYLEPRSYDAALVELNFSRSPDPDPYPFWHQSQKTNGQNYSGWDDRQVSEYLEQARVTDDYNERIKRYRNFQVRFASELPALPLYYPVYTYAVDTQVKGISMGPLFEPSDRFFNLVYWYLVSGISRPETQTTTPSP
ncbi:MAG: hypothetical protein JXB15_15245 [Anaerolineales bacterium]|nr:hypothetical protein [Anaerolineales bacterium]